VLVGAALGIPSLFSSRLAEPRGESSLPSPQAHPVPKALATIQLQARGGESRVLVEDLKWRQVFSAILKPGAP